MEETKRFLTPEGKRLLEEELETRKVVTRKEISQKIKEAREQGDLSENAEYDSAKDEQRDNEARIEEIEKILTTSEVAEETVDTEKISIGSSVKVLDVDFDEEITFYIVGSTESDSLSGKISNESPLGSALMGKHVGDVITVEAPVGEMEYKILEVTR